MGKSLTETAKSILMKESNDPTSDRDAKSMTPLKATLRPGSAYADKMFANPGANSPDPESSYEDLGPALVNNTDVPPSAKAAGKIGKDKSRASMSAVPAEPAKTMAEDMEDDGEVMEEEIELSEELEAFINECIEQGLNEEEIEQAIAENFEVIEEKYHYEEGEKEESGEKKHKEGKKEEAAEKRKEMMKEHVNALLAGENLSEDFRSKAETIFESAVSVRVNEEVAVLEEAYAQSLEEEVANIRAELQEQVDDYLNYVVEQWIQENEVAVESGLRNELSEEFISGLRNLFAEHYIDLPEERVDIVEGLGSRVEELEAKLNEEIERNVGLTKMINESKRFEVIVDACAGLTTTQAERLKALSESVEFTNVNEYAQKIQTLKESYFPTNAVRTDNVLDTNYAPDNGGLITEDLQGPMAQYVKVLGKKLPR